MPDLRLEQELGGIVCGVDEVGRGPLAGPVVAAAIILDQTALPKVILEKLTDSKKMTARAREAMIEPLKACARIGMGQASVQEIDEINILQASLLAMTRAVKALGITPDWALIDGNKAPALSCQTRCIVKGDSLSLSIAAASVIAKVARDAIMQDLARQFPGYGWEKNAGYPTPSHRQALLRLGVTPHHRRSFALYAR